ncbi:hypothetical protein SAMN05444920_106457 [Nonomuraea solani]|uniref:Uncharacterized protein n=1 Tax=Nonomuraea solani TaxID=1144553 RepID=A0A1H6DXM7_9ACTN|nr:hypothetical protein SAMN05444920_106457 [Nonomuraea solani]
MMEFIRGIRTPLLTMRIPASVSTASKVAGELGVPVSEEELGRATYILQVHGEVAAELGDPLAGGVGGDAEDANAAGGVLDDRQNVQVGAGEGTDFEEVARQQCICLAAQEGGPGGGGPFGSRVDAVCFEDLPHGGGGDLDTERGQLTANAPVAPRGVLPEPAATPASGWTGWYADVHAREARRPRRDGASADRGASAGRCPGGPATQGAGVSPWAGGEAAQRGRTDQSA